MALFSKGKYRDTGPFFLCLCHIQPIQGVHAYLPQSIGIGNSIRRVLHGGFYRWASPEMVNIASIYIPVPGTCSYGHIYLPRRLRTEVWLWVQKEEIGLLSLKCGFRFRPGFKF